MATISKSPYQDVPVDYHNFASMDMLLFHVLYTDARHVVLTPSARGNHTSNLERHSKT